MEPIAIIGTSIHQPPIISDETWFSEIRRQEGNPNFEKPTLDARGKHFQGDKYFFDSAFFGISADEVADLDPQYGWALESSYLALENAGISIKSISSSRTAVFATSCGRNPESPKGRSFTLADQLGWFYNLLGPRIHVDATSSGSVAVLDLACQSIVKGDASMALVIGISLVPEDDSGYTNSQPPNGSLGFDGGVAGITTLVIKPLSAAIDGGDHIKALIRSTPTHINHRTLEITNIGSKGQSPQLHESLPLNFDMTRYIGIDGVSAGNLKINTLDFTSLGCENPTYIGSLRSKLGYAGGASSLAGVAKAALLLERGMIPPDVLSEQFSLADWGEPKLQIAAKEIPWPCQGLRRASVILHDRGTYLHIVLDDACSHLHEIGLEGHHRCSRASAAVESSDKSPVLLVWSASSEPGVHRLVNAYNALGKDFLKTERMKHLAHTLAARRSKLRFRTFVVFDSTVQGSPKLPIAKPVQSSKTKLGFIFAGYGSLFAQVGRDLLRYSVFEGVVSEMNSIYAELGCKWSILDEAYGDRINRPEYNLPICTAMQIALVELLKSFHITPSVVIGHSYGEIAAAYTCGALSRRSAARVAYHGGRLAGELRDLTKPGAMMIVNLSESDIMKYLQNDTPEGSDVVVASINGPGNCTLSGSQESIDALKEHLDDEGLFAKRISTGIAYHSPTMHEITEDYLRCMGSYLESGTVTKTLMFSSTTCNPVAAEEASNPQYWTANMTSPVRLSEALQNLMTAAAKSSDGYITDFVEIGPFPSLQGPIKDASIKMSPKSQPRFHSALQRKIPALKSVLNMVGTLFCHGYSASVLAANDQLGDNLPPMEGCPPYPFERPSRNLCVAKDANTEFAGILTAAETFKDETILKTIDQRHGLSVSTIGPTQPPRNASDPADFNRLYSAGFALSLRKALSEPLVSSRRNLPVYMQRYLESVLPYLLDTSTFMDYDERDIDWIFHQCHIERPEWRLGLDVARHLGRMLNGSIDPLEVFFKDANAERFYTSIFSPALDARFDALLDQLTSGRPGLRILEVGAGTGGMTEKVLEALRRLESKDGSIRFYNYTYTDISASFFTKAKSRFHACEYRMKFETLNLEGDVASQGFETNGYDIVVAGCVLHATSNLSTSLGNIRRLLRPEGFLLNLEITEPQLPWVEIMWGSLPGWWLSKEDARKQSPLITEAQWGTLVRQMGFSGLDHIIRDYEEPGGHIMTLMASRAIIV